MSHACRPTRERKSYVSRAVLADPGRHGVPSRAFPADPGTQITQESRNRALPADPEPKPHVSHAFQAQAANESRSRAFPANSEVHVTDESRLPDRPGRARELASHKSFAFKVDPGIQVTHKSRLFGRPEIPSRT